MLVMESHHRRLSSSNPATRSHGGFSTDSSTLKSPTLEATRAMSVSFGAMSVSSPPLSDGLPLSSTATSSAGGSGTVSPQSGGAATKTTAAAAASKQDEGYQGIPIPHPRRPSVSDYLFKSSTSTSPGTTLTPAQTSTHAAHSPNLTSPSSFATSSGGSIQWGAGANNAASSTSGSPHGPATGSATAAALNRSFSGSTARYLGHGGDDTRGQGVLRRLSLSYSGRHKKVSPPLASNPAPNPFESSYTPSTAHPTISVGDHELDHHEYERSFGQLSSPPTGGGSGSLSSSSFLDRLGSPSSTTPGGGLGGITRRVSEGQVLGTRAPASAASVPPPVQIQDEAAIPKRTSFGWSGFTKPSSSTTTPSNPIPNISVAPSTTTSTTAASMGPSAAAPPIATPATGSANLLKPRGRSGSTSGTKKRSVSPMGEHLLRGHGHF